MALIQNLESKIKLATAVAGMALALALATVIGAFVYTAKVVTDAQDHIYVLNGNVPMLAERVKMEETLETECKSHIELFHQLFFNLTPDRDYNEWTIKKALTLGDESVKKQYLALEEKGFYTELTTASAVMTIVCDSINMNMHDMKFTYYGTQRINRLTSTTIRTIVTTGAIENTNMRSQQNPHGLLIRAWKTVQNKEYIRRSNKF